VDVLFHRGELRVKPKDRVKGDLLILAAMPTVGGERSVMPRAGTGARPFWTRGQSRCRAARMRRGMYILPSLFTAGSIGAGTLQTQTIDH